MNAITPINDPRLSFKARGAWAVLTSMADEGLAVDAAFERLRSASDADGQYAVRRALAELEEHGYVTKTTMRTDNGKLAGFKWVLNARPDRKNLAA